MGSAVPAVFPGGPAHPAAVSRDAARDLRSRLTELTAGVRPRVFVVAAPPGVEAAAPVASRHGGRTLLVDAALATPTLDARYPAARRAAAAGGRAVASTLAWLEEPDGDHGVAPSPSRRA